MARTFLPRAVDCDLGFKLGFFIFPNAGQLRERQDVALAVCRTSSIAFPDARSVYFMSLQRARTVHGLILHFQMSRSDRTTPYSPCTNARLIHMTWRPLHAATHKSPPRSFPRHFHASYERYPVLTHSALVENPETGETVRLTVSSSFSWLQGIRGNLRLSSTRNPHRTRSISVASRVLSLRHSRTRSMVVILRVQQGHAFHRMGIRFTRYHVDYA